MAYLEIRSGDGVTLMLPGLSLRHVGEFRAAPAQLERGSEAAAGRLRLLALIRPVFPAEFRFALAGVTGADARTLAAALLAVAAAAFTPDSVPESDLPSVAPPPEEGAGNEAPEPDVPFVTKHAVEAADSAAAPPEAHSVLKPENSPPPRFTPSAEPRPVSDDDLELAYAFKWSLSEIAALSSAELARCHRFLRRRATVPAASVRPPPEPPSPESLAAAARRAFAALRRRGLLPEQA